MDGKSTPRVELNRWTKDATSIRFGISSRISRTSSFFPKEKVNIVNVIKKDDFRSC